MSLSAVTTVSGSLSTSAGSYTTQHITNTSKPLSTSAGSYTTQRITSAGSYTTQHITNAARPASTQNSVSAKRLKVDIDLTTEDDSDFENDLDAEMMLMAEQQSGIDSSSSRVMADNWRRAPTTSTSDMSSASTTLMSSCRVDNSHRYRLETSRTASDSGVNYSTVPYNVTGNRESADANGHVMDVKDCFTDANIRDVKHNSVGRNSSADDNAYYSSNSVPVAASRGKDNI